MLSRIAESLYWIGRYLERSDGTARILDVHLQLALEDPWLDEDQACRNVLSVMGASIDLDRPVGRNDVIAMLVVDPGHPGSIAHSVAAARENARRAREIISTELWEELNRTHTRMPHRVRRDSAHELFRWVQGRAATAIGVVDSGTSRDEAWQFFSLGRAIERADMTARLLATRSITDAGALSWITLLRCCGAYEAYLRGANGLPSAGSAAEFLILDRAFPRSVIASVLRAEQALGSLIPQPTRAGSGDTASRLLGKVRSELEYRPVAETLGDLKDNMERIQHAVAEVSDAIRGRYFPTNAVPVWIGEAS